MQSTTSRAELKQEVLAAIRARFAEQSRRYQDLEEHEQRNLGYCDRELAAIEQGWIRVRLSELLPTAPRAKRQRASDALRQLAAEGVIELHVSASSGRIEYVRLLPAVSDDKP